MRVPLTNVSAAMIVQALLVEWDTVGAYFELVVGSDPATPPNVVVIRDTGARNLGRNMRTREALLKHKIYVHVRCQSYPLGFQKAKEIENALLLGTVLKQITVVDGSGNNILVSADCFSLTIPTVHVGQNENDLTEDFTLNGTLSAMEIH